MAGVAGVWVFAGLGVGAAGVAVGHSVGMVRARGERGVRMGGVGGVGRLWETSFGGSREGSGEDGRRGRGRFVITIERVSSGEAGGEVELGTKVEGRRMGEEVELT